MIRYILLCVLSITLFGCVKNNSEPVWLEISKWEVEKNSSIDAQNAGVLTQNFTDGWIYVNGKLLGIFEFPCKIPVIMEEGTLELIIHPTIRNNGISDVKKVYPFCDSYSVNLVSKPGNIHQIKPITRYATNTKFWIEDFEDPSLKLKSDPNYTATILRENDSAHQLTAGYYGHIHLTTIDSIFQAISNEKLALPKNKEVYLEIDYKNNTSLVAGVVAYSLSSLSYVPYLILTPQTSTPVWKKMYVDLKEVISSATTAVAYDALLKAALTSGVSSEDIYIDNVKIVYN